MRTSSVVWLAAFCVAALAGPASASGATTGTITGVTIDAAGAKIGIQNVRVITDSCVFWDDLFGNRTCGAEIGLVPAAQTCPPQGAGMLSVWSAQRLGTFPGNRTMDSGPLSQTVPTRGQYRICVYAVFWTENFGGNTAINFLTEALSPVPPPLPDPAPPSGPSTGTPTPQPQPTPAAPRVPQLQGSRARTSTGATLASKFGKRWRKGSNRKMSCSRLSSTKIRCKATWRYDGKARKATAVVTRTAAGIKTKLS